MKECKQIENNLPLYLDDSLPAADKKAVEEHLKSCYGCTKILAQLRKTQSMVNNLEEVEPPAWFKQKIMAGVREEAEKKTLIQKIFYPMKIKVPVQIFATVCIAVLVVYIYRTGEDQMKKVTTSSVPAPVMEVQKNQFPERKLKSSTGEMVQNEETVKQEDQTMPLKGATREKDMAVAHDAAKDVNEQVVPSEKADKYESAPAARSVMTAEKADKYENAPAAKSVMIPEDRLEKKKETNVLGAAMKAGRAPQAQGIMPRPVILLKVSNVDKALTDVEKLLIKYEAKNISRQVTHGKTILTLELKNQKVKDFKAQLKTIGRVEDGTIPATDAEGNITLVIEIGNN